MLKFIMTVFFILMVVFPAYASGPIYLDAVNINGLKQIKEADVRSVLALEAKKEVSEEEIDQAINRLRKWDVFDTIEVTLDGKKSATTLNFYLAEAKIITQIEISGNYPYLENKIKKYLTLQAGEMYTPERLDEQSNRIKDFYSSNGFLNTDVAVSEIPKPESDGVEIGFHISKGELLRYRNIEVSGNKHFLGGRFTTYINPYLPYSEKRLRKSINKIEKLYQRHGFLKASVKIEQKKIDREVNKVDLKLAVSEGKQLKINFIGNRNVPARRLKKILPIFKGGSWDRITIDNSEEIIVKYYRINGYPEVKVGHRQEQKDEHVLLTFLIEEGDPNLIKSVRFTGNKETSGKDLSKEMVNKKTGSGEKGAFRPDKIEYDSEIITKNFKRSGFLNAQVGEWDVKKTKSGYAVKIEIPVEEGTQTIIRNIEFFGNDRVKKRRLMNELKFRPKDPFNSVQIEEDKNRIFKYLADHGYPYATVDQKIELDSTNSFADITYEIELGGRVKIGRILIVGDILSSQKAIKKAMSIEEGKDFSYEKIMESQLNIRRLGAFTAVNIETIGLEEKLPKVNLVVRVEEAPPFLVDTEFSYSTDENFTGKFSFTNLNAFGWAKVNSLKLTGGVKLTRAELSWLDPAFLGSSFEMTTMGWLQHQKKPSFNFIQAGGALAWFRRFHRTSGLFRYEIDRNYFIEGDSVAADKESLRNNTLSKITLSMSFDTRDKFSDPRKGIYLIGGSDIFNEIKGNDANFVRLSWSGEGDISPLGRITFATQTRLDRLLTIGSNVSIPTNELLFLGGDYTLRGFAQDSLGPKNANGEATGGRTRWILNEEMRTRLIGGLGFVVFYDMGSLTNNFSDIDLKAVRNSIGFGFRYTTPVGPIRAEYAIKLDRRTDESFGRFHLAFGFVF